MVLILSAGGDDAGVLAELARSRPSIQGRVLGPGLVAMEGPTRESPVPVLALARQRLPGALPCFSPSVSSWARAIVDRILLELPDDMPWRLHLGAHYGVPRRERIGARAWHSATRWGARQSGEAEDNPPAVSPEAGRHRCQLIEESVLALLKDRRRRRLKFRTSHTAPFVAGESLVQVLLTAPDRGWVSVLPGADLAVWQRSVSPFPWGEIPVASDKAAPSRAFAKLVEAETRLGRSIAAGETCVDLGASPGSWSYVALGRGARVTAVDRAPLREDLMQHPLLTFVKGDAFRYSPESPVDWLLCDVIAAPERSIQLLLDWLSRGGMRNFVVSIKLRGPADHPKLDRLKDELPRYCREWSLVQLCANKGEVCAFGRRREVGPEGEGA